MHWYLSCSCGFTPTFLGWSQYQRRRLLWSSPSHAASTGDARSGPVRHSAFSAASLTPSPLLRYVLLAVHLSFVFPLHISITVDNKLYFIFRSPGSLGLLCQPWYGIGLPVPMRPRVFGFCWRARSVGLGTWVSVSYVRPWVYRSR